MKPLVRIPSLDGWRGLAILAVLAGHLAWPVLQLSPVPLDVARLGLDLFFVLSGRLMAEILFIKPTPLPTFYARRVARVWPGLAVFVGAMYVANLFVFKTFETTPGPWLAALTFTLNYYSIYSHTVPVLDHIWSLCVEEHAYLVLGLLALLHRRYGWRPVPLLAGLIAACTLNLLYRTVYVPHDIFPHWRTDIRLPCILWGSLTYLLAQTPHVPGVFRHRAFLILCLILGLGSAVAPVPYGFTCTVSVAGLGWVLANIKVLATASRALSAPGLTYVGVISYSLYLWQQPFYKMDAAHHLGLLFPLLAATLASYYLVKSPARRALNRAFARCLSS